MSTMPYQSPLYAWRYVCYMHRIRYNPTAPLKILASTKSPETVRLMLFQGRQFLLNEDRTSSLAPFQDAAQNTTIKRPADKQPYLLIHPSEEFAVAIESAAATPTLSLLAQLDSFARSQKDSAFYLANLSFDTPQQRALDFYCKTLPDVRVVVITSNSILLRK